MRLTIACSVDALYLLSTLLGRHENGQSGQNRERSFAELTVAQSWNWLGIHAVLSGLPVIRRQTECELPRSRLVDTHLIVRGEAVLSMGKRVRLQVRAEGEQTTVAILHYKLARVPRHVGESASELHALGCILGVKRVRIFDK
jgi:hypothetical protein